MYISCIEKQKKIKELFAFCETEEEKYDKIIELGQKLPSIDSIYKVEENRVNGCQSLMYMHTWKEGDKIFFEADSDALISKGLAYLLVSVYSGEEPEVILKCPPDFLEDLKITGSLTPNRANGLYSMHLMMKQKALQHLIGG